MTIRKYISGDEARQKLFKGLSLVADAVGAANVEAAADSSMAAADAAAEAVEVLEPAAD